MRPVLLLIKQYVTFTFRGSVFILEATGCLNKTDVGTANNAFGDDGQGITDE